MQFSMFQPLSGCLTCHTRSTTGSDIENFVVSGCVVVVVPSKLA